MRSHKWEDAAKKLSCVGGVEFEKVSSESRFAFVDSVLEQGLGKVTKTAIGKADKDILVLGKVHDFAQYFMHIMGDESPGESSGLMSSSTSSDLKLLWTAG